MSKWQVVVTPQAQMEAKGIHDYIANTLLVPQTANRQVQRILDGIRSLQNMPLRLPAYDKEPWHSRGLRKSIVDNFVIFFLPDEKAKTVVVLHIFYAGRDIANMLNNNF